MHKNQLLKCSNKSNQIKNSQKNVSNLENTKNAVKREFYGTHFVYTGI